MSNAKATEISNPYLDMLRAVALGVSVAAAMMFIVSQIDFVGSEAQVRKAPVETASAGQSTARRIISLVLPKRVVKEKPAPVEVVQAPVPTRDETKTSPASYADNVSLVSAQKRAAAWMAQPAIWREHTEKPIISDLPRVAIIIDDMGHNLSQTRRALQLPKEIAFAILPYTKSMRDLPKRARRRGHELLVHMPMAPKSGSKDPGPNVLLADLSPTELRRRIAWNLDQFDGYLGVNNHMGSNFTERADVMRVLLEELSARGLAFIDSRTTSASAAMPIALSLNLPFAERDVFLDNERSAKSVNKQLAYLEKLAARHGSAIAIGHPHNVTLETLASWVKTLKKKGIVLVPVSQILKERGTPEWRKHVWPKQEPKLVKQAMYQP